MNTDFIQIYKNAYSSEYCNHLIDLYNAFDKNGFTQNRQHSEQANKLNKDDSTLFMAALPLNHFYEFQEFHDIFWELYKDYAEKYAILHQMASHRIYTVKIQKTKPGEGYHIWHHEIHNRDAQGRILAFILYLNDIEHGGETEFLYQGMRVKPEQGTLVLWPAYFTHTHRGNPPLQEDKYILTGWVEF